MPLWTISLDASNAFNLESTQEPKLDPVGRQVFMAVEWRIRHHRFASNMAGWVERLECIENDFLFFRVFIINQRCSVFVRAPKELLCASLWRRWEAYRQPLVSSYTGANFPGEYFCCVRSELI